MNFGLPSLDFGIYMKVNLSFLKGIGVEIKSIKL